MSARINLESGREYLHPHFEYKFAIIIEINPSQFLKNIENFEFVFTV